MDQSQGFSAKLRALKNRELGPCTKMLLNILILCLVGFPVLLFAVLGSPQQRGFWCNDASISYPLLEDTLPTSVLILGGVLIPIVTILIVEIVKDSPDNQAKEEVSFKNTLSPKFITITTTIAYFVFGCGCTQIITDVAKYNIGRLRPHFHAVCQTDWNSIQENCSSFHPLYIHPIPCLNQDHHAVREAQLSFFSGHASFSAFTMIYLIFYLEHRLTWHHPTLLKPFLQLLCLMITVYTSITRVFDYYHHWSDVLTGFLTGAIMAYIIARYVSGLVKGSRTYKSHEQKVENAETHL